MRWLHHQPHLDFDRSSLYQRVSELIHSFSTTSKDFTSCVASAFYAEIYLGSVTQQSGTVVTVTMANFKQHRDYKSNSVDDDISLLKLNEPIKFGPNIGMIGLPPLNGPPNTYEGQLATVSGWGRTSNTGTSLPSNLQFVEVEVISNSVCAPAYPGYIKDGMVCTSVVDAATCNGDSGGPLVINDETFGPIQIGIVSFGSAAGCDKLPSVYTRTSFYRPWIYTKSGV